MVINWWAGGQLCHRARELIVRDIHLRQATEGDSSPTATIRVDPRRSRHSSALPMDYARVHARLSIGDSRRGSHPY